MMASALIGRKLSASAPFGFSMLKGNCNGKISFLLFAFLISPSKCGKISKLLVKYPLCRGQLNYESSCVGRAYL